MSAERERPGTQAFINWVLFVVGLVVLGATMVQHVAEVIAGWF